MSAPAEAASRLPQLQGRRMVTDGGMETDLIFHHGVDLPHFAAFPLLADNHGRQLLEDYYDSYAVLAERAGAGLMLESATWRANPDWGDRLGYSPQALAEANTSAIGLLIQLRARYATRITDVVVNGMDPPARRRLPRRPAHGPRGHGGLPPAADRNARARRG